MRGEQAPQQLVALGRRECAGSSRDRAAPSSASRRPRRGPGGRRRAGIPTRRARSAAPPASSRSSPRRSAAVSRQLAVRLLAHLQPDLPGRAGVPGDGHADLRNPCRGASRTGPWRRAGGGGPPPPPAAPGRPSAPGRSSPSTTRSPRSSRAARISRESIVRSGSGRRGTASRVRLIGASPCQEPSGVPPAGHHAQREPLALERGGDVQQVEDLPAVRHRVGPADRRRRGAPRAVAGVPPGRRRAGIRPRALLRRARHS